MQALPCPCRHGTIYLISHDASPAHLLLILALPCRDTASDIILSHQVVAGTSRKRKSCTCGPVVLLAKLLSSCALSGELRPKGIVQTLSNHFLFL